MIPLGEQACQFSSTAKEEEKDRHKTCNEEDECHEGEHDACGSMPHKGQKIKNKTNGKPAAKESQRSPACHRASLVCFKAHLCACFHMKTVTNKPCGCGLFCSAGESAFQVTEFVREVLNKIASIVHVVTGQHQVVFLQFVHNFIIIHLLKKANKKISQSFIKRFPRVRIKKERTECDVRSLIVFA